MATASKPVNSLTTYFVRRPIVLFFILLASGLFARFIMLPIQVGIRYFYPGMMFLALAMIRARRLVAIYVILALIFTRNILEIVWLGIGLLYYPYKLLFWTPVVDAIVMIILYLTMMFLFLQPLLRSKQARLLPSE